MRKGINQKNFEYWRNDVYKGYQRNEDWLAELKAHRVCHEQEILMLKDRIIALEKKVKKLTKLNKL
jgi:hypothetical protein